MTSPDVPLSLKPVITYLDRSGYKTYSCNVLGFDGDGPTLTVELLVLSGAMKVSRGNFSLVHGWGLLPLEKWRIDEASLATLRECVARTWRTLPMRAERKPKLTGHRRRQAKVHAKQLELPGTK